MSRSKWKGPFFDLKLYTTLRLSSLTCKVWSRNSVVAESLVGKRVLVHNGNMFKKLLVIREKVGFKFGDFSYTRRYTPRTFSKKKK